MTEPSSPSDIQDHHTTSIGSGTAQSVYDCAGAILGAWLELFREKADIGTLEVNDKAKVELPKFVIGEEKSGMSIRTSIGGK